jgi:phosphoserine aminotransferase
MSKVHNFSAGPAILPQAAIDASVEALKISQVQVYLLLKFHTAAKSMKLL